jgi:4,5-DOPA dioxygenase extradiol
MTLSEFNDAAREYPTTPRMPVVFIGHGSPMNALGHNRYTDSWSTLGASIPKPAAILVVSAHWLTKGTYVHMSEKPRTIYDFYGFPEELYHQTYPAPGSPIIAAKTQSIVGHTTIKRDDSWGLDHGAWVVLMHMFPNADVPVFQMSIDIERSYEGHYTLGGQLAALREHPV